MNLLIQVLISEVLRLEVLQELFLVHCEIVYVFWNIQVLNPIIIESVGAGQTEVEISNIADITVVVFNPNTGDSIPNNQSWVD